MESTFNTLYSADIQRNNTGGGGYILRFLWLLRKAHTTKSIIIRFFCARLLRRYRLKYGLEISHFTRIGKGLYLGHAFNITINPMASIGDNCNIHKGVTIGQENRGKRKGVPQIGNRVYIGVNSTVSGAVVVGDDVLIAPNCHVNCNVPSHSVVFGNPCIIKHRDNATEGYITDLV